MTFLQRLALTFQDKDGSVAIPEVVAACFAGLGLAAAVWDFFVRSHSFDFVAVAAFAASLVLTLATAQRIRDGLWKPEDRDRHD